VETTNQNDTLAGIPLREHVKQTVRNYFNTLNGAQPVDVFKLVTEEVEHALYEEVMAYTRGNQSLAARIMGISRGTLRTKLAQYFGTTHVGNR
jgi:Fis family transcriptional regulator